MTPWPLRVRRRPAISRSGCAGVFREDVEPGGNFGAFTTNKPAAALKAIGCSWVVVGHSEERKDKLSFLKMYDEAENSARGH